MNDKHWMRTDETSGIKHVFVRTNHGVIASIKLFGLSFFISNSIIVVKSGYADIKHFNWNNNSAEDYFFMLEEVKTFVVSEIMDKFGVGNAAYVCLYLINNFEKQTITITVAERDIVMFDINDGEVWYPLKEFVIVNIGEDVGGYPTWSII